MGFPLASALKAGRGSPSCLPQCFCRAQDPCEGEKTFCGAHVPDPRPNLKHIPKTPSTPHQQKHNQRLNYAAKSSNCCIINTVLYIWTSSCLRKRNFFLFLFRLTHWFMLLYKFQPAWRDLWSLRSCTSPFPSDQRSECAIVDDT